MRYNYGVKIPPVVIVYVVVPEVPTAVGAAEKVYDPVPKVQLYKKPDIV